MCCSTFCLHNLSVHASQETCCCCYQFWIRLPSFPLEHCCCNSLSGRVHTHDRPFAEFNQKTIIFISPIMAIMPCLPQPAISEPIQIDIFSSLKSLIIRLPMAAKKLQQRAAPSNHICICIVFASAMSDTLQCWLHSHWPFMLQHLAPLEGGVLLIWVLSGLLLHQPAPQEEHICKSRWHCFINRKKTSMLIHSALSASSQVFLVMKVSNKDCSCQCHLQEFGFFWAH